MHTIFATNVNDAYRSGVTLMSDFGEPIPSRNGPVLRLSMPVTTRYAKPMQRVLFDHQRNANPFFHLFEALWMLNGDNDVAVPAQFVKSFTQFSDDGITLHGAYGHRWRNWNQDAPEHAFDQLHVAVEMLQADLTNRRVVVGMWDPMRDLNAVSKDIPCNDLIKFMMVHNQLDMMVFCRSNDIIYGCYGANAVHMSMLHEYVASMLGVPIGTYYQISADFHAYTEQPYKWSDYFPLVAPKDSYVDPYTLCSVYPMVTDSPSFDLELAFVMQTIRDQTFHTQDFSKLQNRFFVDIAQPMYLAFQYAQGSMESRAIDTLRQQREQLNTPLPNDWLLAGEQWIQRRSMRRIMRRNQHP